MVKPDQWIKKTSKEKGMIEPFEPGQIRKGISYGVSSYGYDFRLSRKFKVFKPGKNVIMDPKDYPEEYFEEIESNFCIIPAGGFVLARSLEYFRIPRDVLTLCEGKSSYARCGIIVNITPFEPEWEGYVTISISNTAPSPAKIYAQEGIAQVIFLKADGECKTSYKDKKGKYQAQKDITYSKI